MTEMAAPRREATAHRRASSDFNSVAEVKSGIVSLTGEVDWQHQRTNILKSIEQVTGLSTWSI